MDLLQTILNEKGTDLVGALTSQAGFSPDQAQQFLPAAGPAVMDAVASNAGSLDLDDLSGAGNVGSLLGAIDVGGAAAQAGVSAEAGAQGLRAILPIFLGALGSKLGGGEGLASLLGGLGGLGGDAGGMLGGLGKLGGGLLGK